jgi:DNA-binding PadR family transcriptional regulator
MDERGRHGPRGGPNNRRFFGPENFDRRGGGGRRRARRGDIRRAILSALLDGPAHGYEIMGRLEERSGGVWRPSPGSIYPTLQMLEDEGLVRSEDRDGVRAYVLTDKGTQAANDTSESSGMPWDDDEGHARARATRESFGLMFMAAKQIERAGTPEQVDRTIEIVNRARKEIYQILAES